MTSNLHLGETCVACGGKVLPVLYGMPEVAAREASERGELILGGCTLEDVACRCECGATAYEFDESPFDPFGVDEARTYIDETRAYIDQVR